MEKFCVVDVFRHVVVRPLKRVEWSVTLTDRPLRVDGVAYPPEGIGMFFCDVCPDLVVKVGCLVARGEDDTSGGGRQQIGVVVSACVSGGSKRREEEEEEEKEEEVKESDGDNDDNQFCASTAANRPGFSLRSHAVYSSSVIK